MPVTLLTHVDLVVDGVAELVHTLGRRAPRVRVAATLADMRIYPTTAHRVVVIDRQQRDVAVTFDLREQLHVIAAVDQREFGVERCQARQLCDAIGVRPRADPERLQGREPLDLARPQRDIRVAHGFAGGKRRDPCE